MNRAVDRGRQEEHRTIHAVHEVDIKFGLLGKGLGTGREVSIGIDHLCRGFTQGPKSRCLRVDGTETRYQTFFQERGGGFRPESCYRLTVQLPWPDPGLHR